MHICTHFKKRNKIHHDALRVTLLGTHILIKHYLGCFLGCVETYIGIPIKVNCLHLLAYKRVPQ